jgi:ABC-type polysaccharide/polyol phosphate transport system ATPase subunit
MASISLKNVSIQFNKRKSAPQSLKERLVNLFTPPKWKKQISKESFWGLKDINLEIKEGDRLGIIGLNGAGKTTLLKVISQIYKPTEGQVNVKGRIAPLIEIGAGFHPELTGRENIFLNGSLLGISKKDLKARIDSIVEFSELQEFIDTPVKYYSTGMHLRLGFTIATEFPPDILILDEMFAGADQFFISKAQKRLENFIASSKIMLMVTHEMEYVKKFCNRIETLQNGKLVRHEKTP